MSGGMAEVIAAHYMDRDIYICDCGWVWAEHAGNAGSPLIHAAHVAEELAKAGYGNAREVAATALRDAAKDAHARGDVGKEDEGGVSVEAFLDSWAARLEGEA